MKNKIFLIAMLASSCASITLSSESESLKYLTLITAVATVKEHVELSNDNNCFFPLKPSNVEKLHKTPNGSPATFIWYQYNSGFIIPADLVEIIKTMPAKGSDIPDNIYAINTFSPNELLKQLDPSKQKNNLDNIQLAQLEWEQARKPLVQSTSTPNTSYLKPLTLLTCLSVAVALYFFWLSR